MKVFNVELSNYSSEPTLRNDILYNKQVNKDKKFYSFNDLFDIVSEKDSNYTTSDFYYAEIGDVNRDNSVNPVKLNFDNREDDLSNESYYKKISKGDIQKCKIGDILISKIRPYLRKNLYIDAEKSNYYYTSAFICLRPKHFPKLSYYLLNLFFTDKLIAISRQGKGYPTLKESDLRLLKFEKEIVDSVFNSSAILLKQIDALEEEIAINKAKIENTSSIINEVFSCYFNFDNKKFKELCETRLYYSNLSTLSNNIDNRFGVRFHKPSGYFVYEELNKRPHKLLYECLSIPMITGKSIKANEYDENGEYAYVSMADIGSWFFDISNIKYVSNEYSEANLSKKPLNYFEEVSTEIAIDDILMMRSGEGGIGKVAIVKEDIKGIFSDFIIRIRFNPNIINADFGYYFFRTDYFQHLVNVNKKGLGNNTNIFPNQLQNLPIICVSLKEQEIVVKQIKDRLLQQEAYQNEVYNKLNEIKYLLSKTVEEYISK